MFKTALLAAAASLLFAAPVLAKGGSAQTHHCQKDGAEVQMTRKECKKGGGTWEKGAPAGGAAAPAAAAPAPAAAPPAPAHK